MEPKMAARVVTEESQDFQVPIHREDPVAELVTPEEAAQLRTEESD
jgi:hypothetical protein